MLRRKLRDKSGNALIIVILICMVLTITLGGLARSTIVNTNVSQSNTESDKAYLAARSGVEIMKSIGSPKLAVDQSELSASQKDGIQKILDARYDDLATAMGSTAKDISIDLGDTTGTADIKVIKCYKRQQKTITIGTTEYPQFDSAGKPLYEDVVDPETVELVVRGNAGNRSYVVNRKITLKPLSDNGNFYFQSKAYTKVGDAGTESSPTKLSGGVEGDVIITGDGYFTFDGAQKKHPLHKLIVAGNLTAKEAGQDVDIDLIATGGHCIVPGSGTRVHGDILVGLKKNIGDPVYDPYFLMNGNAGLDVEGRLLVEGDIRALNNCHIGTPPAGYDANTYISTVVVYCGGDCNFATWTNKIYGTIVVGGDLHIEKAEVYGDIICYGDVTIDPSVNISGSVYAAGNVTYDTGWGDNIKGDIYAGGGCTINGSARPFSDHLITGSAADSSSFKNIAYQYTTDSAKSAAAGVLSGVIETTFNTKDPSTGLPVDLVGADKYISEEIESSPTPIIKVPDELTATSNVVTINSSKVGTPIEINQEYVKVVGDGTPYQSTYTNDLVYINASANDVNILLQGDVSTGYHSPILVNDGGGAHKVRIFLDEGSRLGTNNYSTAWFMPVSDAAKDKTLAELRDLNASPRFGAPSATDIIDMAKIPRFYILCARSKTHTTQATLDVSSTGYVPGYVIGPGISLSMDTGKATYLEGDSQNPYEWNLAGNQAPVVYGLLLCDDMGFSNYQGTALKYDTRLADEKSARAKIFAKDISDVVFTEK